ncbi:MAG: hypothetical protein RLP44_11885 [Aggregatilineales bacterium]
MTAEIPFHYQTDDARYSIDVIRDSRDEDQPHYDVDLVRSRSGHFGETIEQRLTLAEYDDRAEAESHRQQVEDGIAEQGLSALGDAANDVRNAPILYDGHYLFVTYPPDAEPNAPAAAHLLHLDEPGVQSASLGNGTASEMDALIEQSEQAFTNGQAITLAENEPVRHIDGGGTAHWFAIVERDEPENEPYELRYFRELELADGTQRNDSYPVMPLSNDDPQSAWALPGLEMYLEKGDVYMAQQFAHDVADAYGQDFPEPLDLPSLNPDPEYYFGYGVSEDNQPALEAVKTWMDGAERRFDTLTIGEYGTLDEAGVDELELETVKDQQGVQAAMNLAESMAVEGGYLDPERDDPRIFFEDDAPPDPFTTHRERELAEPQYGIGAISANGEHFLDVYKTWGDDDYERLIVPQPDWETARLHAETAFNLQANDDLQGAMHLIELEGIRAGVIDPDRADLRLFTQGPPDPFETLAQRLEGEINPYWNTDDEVIDEPDPQAQNPYWRLETIPVNDPTGEPLGHAMHMVVYEGVEHDPEMVGTPAIPENEPFRMLEMAHFETIEASDKFGEEFNGYLMPGLLEGPELAEEVARLEGHPVEWKTLEGQEMDDYRDLKLTLTRDPVDWQPYNPNAERDARIEAEGLYTDPIRQFTTFGEDEDEPKVESVSPDFDL